MTGPTREDIKKIDDARSEFIGRAAACIFDKHTPSDKKIAILKEFYKTYAQTRKDIYEATGWGPLAHDLYLTEE